MPDHVVFPVERDSVPVHPDGSLPFALDTPLYDPFVLLSQLHR